MDDFSSIVTAELFEKYVSDFYSESNPQILLYGHVYSQYLKHKGSVRSLSLTICQDPTQVKSCSVKIGWSSVVKAEKLNSKSKPND